jgi:dTDP-4-amino-4,6-dideoxygalactose transaminase|tara:strand:- start:989 stop:2092 length:1104 start_codon:yes stop_codon:yes gene_type:complete
MKIRKTIIPVLQPYGDAQEVDAIKEVIESGWWGKGPKVTQFEQEFAELVGSKYAIAVTSNSHGQDLIMKAMGFKGVDVINPTMSFATTAVVPLWNDCTSNIVDVLPDTMCIDPSDVTKYKKSNSEVLIAVNFNGTPAPIDEIRKVFGGFIIEDCAHSCYTEGAGTKGDVAVWSFQAVKSMPTGDGGMITLNDKELYEKMSNMIWFGIEPTWKRFTDKGYAWDYDITTLGYKYYMIDLIAALGLSQLKRLPDLIDKRQYIQKVYNERLHENIQRPEWSEVCQYYSCRVNSNYRNELIDYLAEKNIHTSVHFKPLHLHPLLKQNRKYPVADVEWKKMITLPCYYNMSDNDLEYVIYWVNKFVEKNDLYT